MLILPFIHRNIIRNRIFISDRNVHRSSYSRDYVILRMINPQALVFLVVISEKLLDNSANEFIIILSWWLFFPIQNKRFLGE